MNNAVHVAGDRPRLCRSEFQPNLLDYIDTTLTDLFALDSPLADDYDQFSNTPLDQYLLYLLCQKIAPNHSHQLDMNFYQLLHQLIVSHGRISKGFFEYAPPAVNRPMYEARFNGYTNFIWNEFDVHVLLELGCFLLKYRLRDTFTVIHSPTSYKLLRSKMIGYFLEMLAIYYLASNHREFFTHSRSTEMMFPSPSATATLNFQSSHATFEKFLDALHANGEIHFDTRQMKSLLQSDAHQFVHRKLENRKIGFLHFLDKHVCSRQRTVCRSLKSLCRLTIKLRVQNFPDDIQQLRLFSTRHNHLRTFLTYESDV